MKEIQLIIIAAGVLAVLMNIFEGIYPSEKYAKQMRIIFALIFVLCFFRPFFSCIGNISQTVESIDVLNEKITVNNDNTLEYFKKSVERNISSRISGILEENGIRSKEIKTSINISDNGGIFINEVKIAVEDTAQGVEAVDIVKHEIGEETLVKIEEFIQ